MNRASRPTRLALMALLAGLLLPALVSCGPKGPPPERDDAALSRAAKEALGESAGDVTAEIVSYELHPTYWTTPSSLSPEHNVQEYVVRYAEPKSGLYREDSVLVRAGADPEHRFQFLLDYRTVPEGVLAPLCAAFADAAGTKDGRGFLPSVEPIAGVPDWYGVTSVSGTPSRIEPVSVAYAAAGRPAELYAGLYGHDMEAAASAWQGNGTFPAAAWARWAAKAAAMESGSSKAVGRVLDDMNGSSYSGVPGWLAYVEGTMAESARVMDPDGAEYLSVRTSKGTYAFSRSDGGQTRVRRPGDPVPPEEGMPFDYDLPTASLPAETDAARADWHDGEKR